MVKSSSSSGIVGVGVSARPQHFDHLLKTQAFPWLEVLADNYLHEGSVSQDRLVSLSERYPLVFHCVGLSLGSSTDFNWDYLKSLKRLARHLKPHWISDHLCFSSFGSSHYHDLIPLPYTEDAAQHVAQKIRIAQDFLECPLLIENVSNYMSYSSNKMTEPEFLHQILELTHADLLLDLNNIYVNSFNYEFDPYEFIDQIDLSRVKQMHLAGFKDMEGYLIDTHSRPVHDSVLSLYNYVCQKATLPVCLEWDEDIPDFHGFQLEHQKIEKASRSY